MEIITVREKRIDGKLVGYFVNECAYFQKDDCLQVNQWIAQGNTPEPEFTYEETLKKEQNEFRLERNALLDKVDKEINKSEDLGNDSARLRIYRQSLRDATITWVMPEGIL